MIITNYTIFGCLSHAFFARSRTWKILYFKTKNYKLAKLLIKTPTFFQVR
jgi:hypothetical protein